jgi:hypothetical protein
MGSMVPCTALKKGLISQAGLDFFMMKSFVVEMALSAKDFKVTVKAW